RRHVSGGRTGRGVQELDVPRHRGHVLARHGCAPPSPQRASAGRRRLVLAPPVPRSGPRVRRDSGAAAGTGVRMNAENAETAEKVCSSISLRALRALRSHAVTIASVLLLCVSTACARRSSATPPSNDLLIVGYDREPDTLNRFSTHILEDIQTCVVEGLTTTDERM